MTVKRVISVNLEDAQIKDLEAVIHFSGIDNQQVHYRLAMRQYLAREMHPDKIPEKWLKDFRLRQQLEHAKNS